MTHNPIDDILGNPKQFKSNESVSNPIDAILGSPSKFKNASVAKQLAPYGVSGIGPYLSEVANVAREFANTSAVNPINVGNRLFATGINKLLGTHMQPYKVAPWKMELKGTPAATVGKATGDLLGFTPAMESGGFIANALGKGPLLGQILGSAGYQASQAKGNGMDVLKAMGGGATLGGISGLAGKAVSAAAKPLVRYISGQSVSPIMEKAEALFKQHLPQTDQTIATELGKAYQTAKANVANWSENLMPLAKAADNEGLPFDSTTFKKTAQSIIDKYEPKMKRLPEKYGAAKKALNRLINNPPQSYEDATYLNEEINELPKTWQITNDAEKNVLRDISSKMNAALKEQVTENASKSTTGKQFADEWRSQLQKYKFLKSFSQLPVGRSKEGLKLAFKRPLAEKIENTGIPDEDIARYFMPTSHEDGTMKMEHLANLLDSHDNAANLLKAQYFKDATAEGIFNSKRALSQYLKLSDKQREFMFTEPERTLLNAAAKAKKTSEKDRIITPFLIRYGSKLNPFLIGGGLGGAYGYHHGDAALGMVGGTLAASSAPYLIEAIANKLANPAAINRLYNASENGLNTINLLYPLQSAVNPFFAHIRNSANASRAQAKEPRQ